jgi:short-subunit dehydrogenase
MATALVTGGTSGIGAQFARTLAARGWDLVLVARDTARLEAMAAELTAVSVETITADLADRADVDRVAARIEDASRPIDMLVNNAGFGMHTSLLSRDLAIIDRAWEVMMRAVLVLGGAAGRSMRARGEGRIVNVASTAGFITLGAYSAAKAWVTSYSEGLSNELHGSGVTVTAVCPGWVRTEFHERAGIRASSIPSFLWLDAETLVNGALKDVMRGRVISITSVRYRVLIWFARHLPKGTIRRISRAISSSRSESDHDEVVVTGTNTET